MKQSTTPKQTAKLIELGFEKPTMKNIPTPEGEINEEWYSIGELIEMLPMTIADEIWWGEEKGEEGVWGLRIDTNGTEFMWSVSYERDHSAHLYLEGGSELVDALYDMLIKLKEEGVI